jgi:cation:H+ antiporter
VDVAALPLWTIIALFLVAAITLMLVGSRFAGVVDEIADRTGIGEAIAGAVLLGATTSLPGLMTSVIAAWEGQAGFAVSNSVGGIAAQTTFLAVADMIYRRVNLEHAAASVPNLLQSVILIMMVSTVLFARGTPDFTILGVHPVTILLLVTYGYGLRMSRQERDNPMWQPVETDETVVDDPDADEEGSDSSLSALWGRFGVMAATVAVSGWVIAQTGLAITEVTPLSGTVVGGLFTSVASSLPELVTVIAAVRIGALTLAVSDIVGGNIFDVLFVGAADVAYRDGSVYHALEQQDLFLLALTLMLAAILAAGLIHRQMRGIGFEGLAILTLYLGGSLLLFTGG